MSRTRSSLLLSFLEKYALVAIALTGSMVLARLLTPQDVGQYAVGAVLLGVLQVLRDFGVGQYVVKARLLGQAELRAVLAASYLFAWPLALLVALLAAPLAAAYRSPGLAEVLHVLALNFVLVAPCAVALPLLRRELRFGAILAINLAHGVAGLAVSVLLAWLGWGALALAWGTVASHVAMLAMAAWLRPATLPWLPAWAGMRRVIRFGLYATGGNLIDEAGVAAPELIIGRLLGMEAVGIFSKANSVLALFHRCVTNAVAPVAFTVFAVLKRERRDAGAAYLRTASYLTALAWPFFAWLALMALPVVRFLYGGQWDAAAPLIRLMCLSSALYSMTCMARYLLVAGGQVRAQARIDALAVGLRIAGLLLAAPFGLEALALAVVAGTLCRVLLTWAALERIERVGGLALARACGRSALLAGISALGPVAALLFMAPGALQLAAATAAALGLWLGALGLLHHPLNEEVLLARRRVAARLSS